MKVSVDLALRQSLTLNQEMRLAIDMLAMSTLEIDEIIDEELLKNPSLEEREFARSMSDASSAFDVALETETRVDNFRDALLQQIGESAMNAIEREIAYCLVNNLDDDGLLPHQQDVYARIVDDLGVYDEWIETVRRRILDLDPVGCAAFDSCESLMHQAQKLCHFPHDEFMTLLASIHNEPDQKIAFSRISRMKNDDALDELRKLFARPAMRFQERQSYVDAAVPDVVVKHGVHGFQVLLTKKPSERLMICANSDVFRKNAFLRENRRRALFMMKAMQYRETGLAKVSRAIVLHQEEWLLEKGPIKPLTLREIADVCSMHESSVSRLTKGKYLLCDRGVFELKYFFSAKIASDSNEGMSSSLSVKDRIKTIVNKEEKTCPLSDQKIVERLIDEGFHISRRTVTKYREAMEIPSAQNRRTL